MTPPWHEPTLVQVFVWTCVDGQVVGDNVKVQLLSLHGGIYVHVCEVIGLPPVQPVGEYVVIVLV